MHNFFFKSSCLVSGFNHGNYGKNCSTPCPQNCLDGLCDIVNGMCFGCLGGYNGPNCSEGYYHRQLITIFLQ